jgi:fructuronate reductase
MELSNAGLKNRQEWEKMGYALPKYDRQEMIRLTREAPFWVHFGAGNIFRAFQANGAQRLLNEEVLRKGIVVAEGFDGEIISSVYAPYDDLSILVTLKADGSMEKTVVGSVAEAVSAVDAKGSGFARLREIFRMESLQLVSFTITEKGYSLYNGRGELLPDVAEDFRSGPSAPTSYMGKIAALLYERFLAGGRPLAMVSMDNCSHNGEKLFGAVWAFAETWEKSGAAKTGFCAYVKDPAKVSFPWTMIDKITPRPDASVEKCLKEDGLSAMEPVVTGKHTYTAPFVNAEECEYLVIEDSFPNGRPALEKAGFIFTSRETVNDCERMKVCTCLNPLHTALAVYGCLLGYTLISEEMKNPLLKKLVERIGYIEGLPVVTDPGILSPREFLDTVLNVRIPNPFMPDTPQRIATDTSQKLSIRFGETVKAYRTSPSLRVEDLVGIPLVHAGWLRYLMAVDDMGEPFTPSPDPLLENLSPVLGKFSLGHTERAEEVLTPILRDASIFGVDLFAAGLGERVLQYFRELSAGKGAVEATLRKYTASF